MVVWIFLVGYVVLGCFFFFQWIGEWVFLAAVSLPNIICCYIHFISFPLQWSMKNSLCQNVYSLFKFSYLMLAKCVLQLKTKSLYHSGGKIIFSTILINVQMCFLNYKVSSSLWRDKTCRDFFFSWVLILPFVWIILSLSCSSEKFRCLNKFWMLGHSFLNLLIWKSDINCVPLEILTTLLILGKSSMFCNIAERVSNM